MISDFDLTSNQIKLLMAMDKENGITRKRQQELGIYTTKTWFYYQKTQLLDYGLIKVTEVKDTNEKVYSLTEKGAEVVHYVKKILKKIEGDV